MAAQQRRAAEGADKEKAGDKLAQTTLFRWKPDWEGAAALHDEAAGAFKAAKDYKSAARCFVKAAQAFETMQLSHAAGLRLVSAAGQLDSQGVGATVQVGRGEPETAENLLERASLLFSEHGSNDQAAEALVKAAKHLAGDVSVKVDPETAARAVELCLRACEMYQSEGRDAFMNQTYRFALGLAVKYERYEDAIELLQRQCESFATLNQAHEVHKAHLSIIVLRLKQDDFVAAEQHFQKATADADGFAPSTEGRVAADLLDAMEKRDADALHEVLEKQQFGFLDNQVSRVAASLKKKFGSSSGASRASSIKAAATKPDDVVDDAESDEYDDLS